MNAIGKAPRRLARSPEDLSLAERVALLPDHGASLLDALSDPELLELYYDWAFWARPKQLPPPGDWFLWLLLAGRGFGKTATGRGWVHERAMQEKRWIALIAKTPADARDVMIEGPAGFCDRAGKNIAAAERPVYEPSKRRLSWPTGSWATIYSSEDPEQLRGYSGDTAWADEVGKYDNPEAVWDNLLFGMRECSADQPRVLMTTTPKPGAFLTGLAKRDSTRLVTGNSYENEGNLDPTWFKNTISIYEGTKFGRQEIYAEILDPEEGGIVERRHFRLWPRNKPLPQFEFVLLSLDTAFTERTRDEDSYDPDPTAAGVYGLFQHDGRPNIMVLDCWDEHLGFPQLVERVAKEMKIAYGSAQVPLIRPLHGAPVGSTEGRVPDLLIIEDKGSGISLRQQLAREGDFPAYAYNPGRLDKLQRLHLVSHVVVRGLVWLVESETNHGKPKTWTEPLLSQVCSFKGEGSIKHDDHVDQFTQALRVLLDKHLVSVTDVLREKDDTHALPLDPPSSPFGRPLLDNVYAR